jgi:RimJ/RimL family protein N-acetyltransferase
MELTTPHCVVRSYRIGDAPSLAEHANNRKIWLNLRDRFPHPFRESDGEAYIASVLARPEPTSFAIDVDGNAVGGISLRVGSDIERLSAEIGYWLGEAFWGRGIMSNAVTAVTDFGFRELHLVRIFAIPFAHNTASHRVLEKAGYQREGVLRASAIKDGQILDEYLYARVDPESVRAAARA